MPKGVYIHKPIPIEVRFWRKVARLDENSCWLWLAGTNNRGYGQLGGERVGSHVLAHRISYQLRYGPIPDGLQVMHKCDTPRCCNPKHLALGTNADNSADKVSKGRQARGESHGLAICLGVKRKRLVFFMGQKAANDES
jgi:HNH endonuclease